MPVSPAGTVTRVTLVRIVKPAGAVEGERAYVSAAGPWLWMTTWKAVGIEASWNGTVKRGSGLTAIVMPGRVGATLTSTVACATRSGSLVDRATTRMG